MCAFTAYFTQCYGYIAMQTKFTNIKREFVSPLGIPGAVFGSLVFLLGAISVIGFQNDNQFAFIAYLSIVFIVSLYYYFYSKHHQTFSDDEQKILFVAHVINYNVNRNRQPTRARKLKITASGGVRSDYQSKTMNTVRTRKPVGSSSKKQLELMEGSAVSSQKQKSTRIFPNNDDINPDSIPAAMNNHILPVTPYGLHAFRELSSDISESDRRTKSRSKSNLNTTNNDNSVHIVGGITNSVRKIVKLIEQKSHFPTTNTNIVHEPLPDDEHDPLAKSTSNKNFDENDLLENDLIVDDFDNDESEKQDDDYLAKI